MDPASGSRFRLWAEGLRLLLEMAGAHRRVRARFFVPPGALTFLLAVQYPGVLLLAAVSGEKLSALIAVELGRASS